MYRSARARKKARRRQLTAIGAAAAMAAALGLAFVAFGSGGSAAPPPSGCVILDVSESTSEARSRYASEFAKFATAIADEGSGEICVVVAAADPVAESAPLFTSVAPAPGSVGTPKAPGEIERNVATATATIEELLEDPPVRQRGSGLVEAASVASEHMHTGDRLLFLSDGLQWSDAGGHLMKMELTPATIAEQMQKLREADLLPDMKGIDVNFPLLLFHPQSYHGHVVSATKIRAYWEDWAAQTGADLTIGSTN